MTKKIEMFIMVVVSVVGSVPSFIIGNLLIWGTLIKRSLFGEMKKITNCTINGKKINLIPFMKALNVEGKPFVIDTDEGKIIVCHGQPNGRFELNPKNIFGNHNATYKQLIEYLNLEPGKYQILSCFNGKRGDYVRDGYTIRRVQGSLSSYPTVASMINGTLRLSADRWFLECFLKLVVPIFQWGQINNIIKEMENIPSAPAEEENTGTVGTFGGIKRKIFDADEIEKIKEMIRNRNANNK